MSNPVLFIVRAWRWGIALIIVVGLVGACPLLTGTYIPFFLVSFQVLVILTLVALTIIVKVWQVLPPSLKLLLLLTFADRLAGRRQCAIHQVLPIPVVPHSDQQYAQYEQPGASYPEMLPPQ